MLKCEESLPQINSHHSKHVTCAYLFSQRFRLVPCWKWGRNVTRSDPARLLLWLLRQVEQAAHSDMKATCSDAIRLMKRSTCARFTTPLTFTASFLLFWSMCTGRPKIVLCGSIWATLFSVYRARTMDEQKTSFQCTQNRQRADSGVILTGSDRKIYLITITYSRFNTLSASIIQFRQVSRVTTTFTNNGVVYQCHQDWRKCTVASQIAYIFWFRLIFIEVLLGFISSDL